MLLVNRIRCCKRSIVANVAPITCLRRNHSEPKDNASATTHFGFETVSEAEKEKKVYKVFANVADKYDVMNDSMSLGVHRLWKDYFIEQLAPTRGTRLLDVAGGTGDIAFRFLKYLQNGTSAVKYSASVNVPEESHVTVCDINSHMLSVGQKRAKNQRFSSGISWVQGNAECLPMDANIYDAYTIAFGIRNCTHIDKVLTEAYRVLKPGGRFMCLEFSDVKNPILGRLYDEYSFQVIPVLGQVIAGDWHSYQYLVESIRNFPNQQVFAEMIKDVGFKAVTHENLLFGVSAIHSGFKL